MERPDRRTVERNRRIRMRALYNQLYALLPASLATRERGSVPLHDRLDETVSYIRGLQERIEGMKERKRQLSGEEGTSQSAIRLPHIEVQDHGAGLQVVITSSPRDWFAFIQAIRVIEEDGAEIISANFSMASDKALHVIHLLVGEPRSGQEASRLLERLKNDIHSPF